MGLREGLLALGYRENEQFILGVRFTQGDPAALPTAARELVRLGVDLIFISAPVSTAKAAQRATDRISIVFAGVGDPLGSGLVQSFAQPGGNITGVTNLSLDLSPKRLELFRQTIPTLKRVLYPYNPADTYAMAQLGVYRDAARRLGIELVEQTVHSEEEAQATLAQLQKGQVDGILPPDSVSFNVPGFVLEAASLQAIPTMFSVAFWVERGALVSYGPDLYATDRQSARHMRSLWLLSVLLVSALGDARIVMSLEVGEQAPDFTLPSTTGEQISLSQSRGRNWCCSSFM
jgi:putative ABC transport system substrate-binding protein